MRTADDHLRFPSGRTVGDCRKDAKRLARATGASLAEAREQVARMNGAPLGWDRTLHALRQSALPSTTTIKWSAMDVNDARAVFERLPHLTRFGIGPSHDAVAEAGGYLAAVEKGQAELTSHLDECNRALRFLRLVDRRKSFNERVGTSYGLKHQAQFFLEHADVDPPEDPYVSNGAFICAAVHAGFEVRLSPGGSPNVEFNMSSRSPVFAWRRVARLSTCGDPKLAQKMAALCAAVGATYKQPSVHTPAQM